MGLLTPGQLGLELRFTVLVRTWGKSLPSFPQCVGAPLTVVAPGVAVACSVLGTFEGGDGSMEFVRSCVAACGFAEVARGGLVGMLDQGTCRRIDRIRLTRLTPTLPSRLLVAQL